MCITPHVFRSFRTSPRRRALSSIHKRPSSESRWSLESLCSHDSALHSLHALHTLYTPIHLNIRVHARISPMCGDIFVCWDTCVRAWGEPNVCTPQKPLFAFWIYVHGHDCHIYIVPPPLTDSLTVGRECNVWRTTRIDIFIFSFSFVPIFSRRARIYVWKHFPNSFRRIFRIA